MTIRGYPNQQKTGFEAQQYTTVNPCRRQQNAVDVLAHMFHQVIAADAVEAGAEVNTIPATAHSAWPGDLISITSGAQATTEVRVLSTSANLITLAENLPAALAVGVTFDIMRPKAPAISSSGTLVVNTSPAPLSYVDSARNVYSVTNVTSGAWVELIASTPAEIQAITLFDSSGRTLELGLGAAASETRLMIVPPGGIDGIIPILIPVGSRLSIRAISATASAGEIDITGFAP